MRRGGDGTWRKRETRRDDEFTQSWLILPCFFFLRRRVFKHRGRGGGRRGGESRQGTISKNVPAVKAMMSLFSLVTIW